MTAHLRLILFDVDGTLVDSQGAIVGAMTRAFGGLDLPVPERAAILSIVGLSLDRAMEQLFPDGTDAVRRDLVEGYKSAYHAARVAGGAGHSPLYRGAREALEVLHAVPDYLLGVATGKSQRGLDGLLEAHGIGCFVTRQVADHHPSKPHPSMIRAAMAETGVEPENVVMIGDTSFDMVMARAAGVTGIGVDWGYHPVQALDADHVISDFGQLQPLLQSLWREQP
jgi:phosphoglycolate phosphatase